MNRKNQYFPFAIGDSLDMLGIVAAAETECPGIQYISAGQEDTLCEEYYAVLEGSVPHTAAAFGRRLSSLPDILLYPLYSADGGWKIIEYEIQKYRVQNRLAAPISLLETALEGMETVPSYFGAFLMPANTPWGRVVRHRTIGNGVCWMETDQCCQAVAVCRIMCDDLSETALGLACTDHEEAGMPDTWGFLFFAKEDSCVPLFELLPLYPEWSGVIDRLALMNAILQYQPKYAIAYNLREQLGMNSLSGQLLQELAADFPAGPQQHLIVCTPEAGSEFLTFLH